MLTFLAPRASALHRSVPCLGHPLGKTACAQSGGKIGGKKSLPHHLLFVALPPRVCDLQRASSLALSPILASAETALLSPCQHHPAAVPVSCPSCHQHYAITLFYCVSIPRGDEVSFLHFHRSRRQPFFFLPVSDTVSSLLILSLE